MLKAQGHSWNIIKHMSVLSSRPTLACENSRDCVFCWTVRCFVSATPLRVMPNSSAALSLLAIGGVPFERCKLRPNELKTPGNSQSQLALCRSPTQLNHRRSVSVCAEYGDGSRGGGGDFLAGFLFGGAVFATLTYIFAPQIRRSLLNEDEYGFRKARRPIYYDDGLERTRQTLNDKISQLNSAIDNVSSRLRGGNNVVAETMDNESEVEATM